MGFIKSIFSKKTKKAKVKFGYDSNGMPYIDMSDRSTAIIFKNKIRGFKGIKTA